MEERQIWIEQMVSDVSSYALRLDETRLRGFLGWLEAHSSRMKVASQTGIEIASEEKLDVQMKDAMKGWFESLPIPGLLWEYHLLLNEIAWRREPSRMMKLQGQE